MNIVYEGKEYELVQADPLSTGGKRLSVLTFKEINKSAKPSLEERIADLESVVVSYGNLLELIVRQKVKDYYKKPWQTKDYPACSFRLRGRNDN